MLLAWYADRPEVKEWQDRVRHGGREGGREGGGGSFRSLLHQGSERGCLLGVVLNAE